MKYRRMPIEVESPEQLGYSTIQCNLAESSVADLKFRELNLDLNDLVLAYGNHLGKPELRDLIAAQHTGISADDILITAGAANALFIVASALLTKDDRIVVEFPNYATNLETPFAIGCDVVKAEVKFENEFRLDVEELRKQVNGRTKLISVTVPHNPTGTVINPDELSQLVELAEQNNCILLVDETYRDLVYEKQLPLAASLSENVISISSLSKATGLPGIRIGWLITKNKRLFETFLAAKEQIIINTSVLDEEVAWRFMQNSTRHLETMRQTIREKRSIVEEWMKTNEHMEWISPSGGVVCFPRMRSASVDMESFYKILIEEYSTLVGRGRWFGMDDRYMRIGFGWPGVEELKNGLQNITHAIQRV